MADESYATASTTTVNAANPSHGSTSASAGPSTSNAPPAFTLRRAATVGQPSQLRRRFTNNGPPPSADNNTFSGLRRRSSTYSDYLETSADDLLNPSKSDARERPKSPFVYVPLTLALLPAIAGVFFENGASFFTDLILLSLAAVFLHWSVTQPWDWYHSAQQVRVVQDEILSSSVFESDSDLDSASASAATALEDLPEEKEKGKEDEAGSKVNGPSIGSHAQREARETAALKELYIHEITALAWCFIFPMLSAYLLHTIRSQLSRPSEGLVSDYNLTIFLCAAELRPVSHLIRMLQQRTLHIQAIVAQNPHAQKAATNDQIQALSDRLEELEARDVSPVSPIGNVVEPEIPQKLVDSAVGREFRRSIQPELEALNRAMRRYEKKLNLLAAQTDHRVEHIEYRLNDAIALAAVAAKNSSSRWWIGSWVFEGVAAVCLIPLQTAAALLNWPLKVLEGLVSWRWKRKQKPGEGKEKMGRDVVRNGNGNGKAVARDRERDRDRDRDRERDRDRGSVDRVPGRVARR
ncbi:hypothetical protein F4777DRAFT_299892 [Nemania sp. FL0916]|nr:hypothetical protein F4777DRAFT_299892 [Nemania sp. FL0916]